MKLQAMKAAEVLQLANAFRQRAAEAADTTYHRLMLQTAMELEERAGDLQRHNGTELVVIDDGEDDEIEDA